MTTAFLPFYLDKSAFLIEAALVREILGARTLTPIPHAVQAILGVFPHNGVAVPAVDLASSLKLPPPVASGSSTSRSRLIVLYVEEDAVAFGADEVWEVVQFGKDELNPVHVSPCPHARAEVEWEGGIATVLDAEALARSCLSGRPS